MFIPSLPSASSALVLSALASSAMGQADCSGLITAPTNCPMIENPCAVAFSGLSQTCPNLPGGAGGAIVTQVDARAIRLDEVHSFHNLWGGWSCQHQVVHALCEASGFATRREVQVCPAPPGGGRYEVSCGEAYHLPASGTRDIVVDGALNVLAGYPATTSLAFSNAGASQSWCGDSAHTRGCATQSALITLSESQVNSVQCSPTLAQYKFNFAIGNPFNFTERTVTLVKQSNVDMTYNRNVCIRVTACNLGTGSFARPITLSPALAAGIPATTPAAPGIPSTPMTSGWPTSTLVYFSSAEFDVYDNAGTLLGSATQNGELILNPPSSPGIVVGAGFVNQMIPGGGNNQALPIVLQSAVTSNPDFSVQGCSTQAPIPPGLQTVLASRPIGSTIQIVERIRRDTFSANAVDLNGDGHPDWDLNGDGIVDWRDRRFIASRLGLTVNQRGYWPRADANLDGTITLSDFQTFAASWIASVACKADYAGLGGTDVPDGTLTVDDLIAYWTAFFNNDPAADIASLGGSPVPDGAITVDDYVLFNNWFFGGCP